MRCDRPIRIEALLDYWAGELPPERAGAIEEHVFACEGCAARLAELEALAAGVRRLTAAGRFRSAVAPSVVALLAARGLRVRTYVSRAGETIPCGAAPQDELLVTRVPVALRGVGRVDVVLCDDDWGERERVEDVPVDRRRDELLIAERVDTPALRAAYVVRFRVVAVDAGGERELGAFALAHDPRGPPGTAG